MRQTHPEHCESAQLSQRHFKKNKTKKIARRADDTNKQQTRLNGQETYFAAAAKVGTYSHGSPGATTRANKLRQKPL